MQLESAALRLLSLRASALCQDKRGHALVSRLPCKPSFILAHG